MRVIHPHSKCGSRDNDFGLPIFDFFFDDPTLLARHSGVVNRAAFSRSLEKKSQSLSGGPCLNENNSRFVLPRHKAKKLARTVSPRHATEREPKCRGKSKLSDFDRRGRKRVS